MPFGRTIHCVSLGFSDERLAHRENSRVGHPANTLYPVEPFGRTIQCMSLDCSDERLAGRMPRHPANTLYPVEPFGRTIQCISLDCSDERLHYTRGTQVPK
jgi:hypothetical protein